MSDPIENMIQMLSRLPGLGPRSGRRLALYLIKRKEGLLEALIKVLKDAQENIKACSICGNVDMGDPCAICSSDERDMHTLCVVQDVADLWAIERSRQYKGKYHILGGLLSAIEGLGPDELKFEQLCRRVGEEGFSEIILALPLTVEGQTTTHYLTEMLEDMDGIRLSTLAHGVPVGGELDYMDDATIKTALNGRKSIGN